MLPELTLNHLNLPAREPERLSLWYVETLGFKANGRFLWSGGSLLVFVPGEPLSTDKTHFGFRVGSMEELESWVTLLRLRGVEVADIEGDENYATVFVRDPEGNTFEIFHEPPPALGTV